MRVAAAVCVSVVAASWPRSQIEYLTPPASGDSHDKDAFIGSPSILNTGTTWLASHDRFFSEPIGTTYILAANASDLSTWKPVATVSPMYWAQLFGVNGTTYIIGTSSDATGKGDLVISRCVTQPCDGGEWTTPSVLFEGTAERAFHTAPSTWRLYQRPNACG